LNKELCGRRAGGGVHEERRKGMTELVWNLRAQCMGGFGEVGGNQIAVLVNFCIQLFSGNKTF
jgi:hypothetical protein